jgi:hypothetical protein
MAISSFFKGLVASDHSGSLEEALKTAASEKKFVLVDIYSPL